MLPKEKQLVALLWTNSVHCLAGYLAALKGGHAIVLLDGTAKASSLYPLLQTYMPNYVWKPQNWGRPNTILGKEYSLMPFNEVEINLNPDLALLLPLPEAGESGLMRFSYESLQHQAEGLAEYLEITEEAKAVIGLQTTDIVGIGLMNALIQRGACQMFVDQDFDRQLNFWQWMQTEKVNLFANTLRQLEDKLNEENEILAEIQLVGVCQLGSNIENSRIAALQKNSLAAGNLKLLFQVPGIGIVSGHSYFESGSVLQNAIGTPLPLTRIDVIEPLEASKIKVAYTIGRLQLRSIGIPMGPATEVSDLDLDNVFEGTIDLNTMGSFSEDGFYFISNG
jgi:hypothetical protein